MRRSYVSKKNILFIVLILLLGIGFAFLTTALNIGGVANVESASWNIHFANLDNVSHNTRVVVNNEAVITPDNDKEVTFDIELNTPGDYYEFQVDCVNEGTLDAMIYDYELSGIPESLEDLLIYEVTYADNGLLQKNHLLASGTSERIKVKVKYNDDIEADDLTAIEAGQEVNTSFSFFVEYGLADENALARKPEMGSLMKNDTLGDNVDFSVNPVNEDLNGIYEFTEAGKKVYFYRGAVDNNVLFADMCWKAVRTTKDGGTKLLYNGLPDENNQCNNSNEASILPDKSAFNSTNNAPIYNGYMYGTKYSYSSMSSSMKQDGKVFGNDVTWNGSSYSLVDTIRITGGWNTDKDLIASNHHYTCNSTDENGTCTSVYYVYYTNADNGYYITLNGGKNIEDAWNEMTTNVNDSTIKTAIDTWFESTSLYYYWQYNLEDAVYCNDRTRVLGGWTKDGDGSLPLIYGSRYRNGSEYLNAQPSLECSPNDSFTVYSSNGNGALSYPVGLITNDELYLSGRTNGGTSLSVYSLARLSFWTMSPYEFDYWYTHEEAWLFFGDTSDIVTKSYGVRPVITVKKSNTITSGSGTKADPYVIEMLTH